MKITIGLVALANHVSVEHAIAVRTLREGGAVVYVKTTMAQTGMVCFFPEKEKGGKAEKYCS